MRKDLDINRRDRIRNTRVEASPEQFSRSTDVLLKGYGRSTPEEATDQTLFSILERLISDFRRTRPVGA